MATVLIVDDHDGFRATAGALLAAGGFAVVGEAATGAEAVAAAVMLVPDVVLLDVRLPDRTGFMVSRDIRTLVRTLGFVTKAELSAAALAAILSAPQYRLDEQQIEQASDFARSFSPDATCFQAVRSSGSGP